MDTCACLLLNSTAPGVGIRGACWSSSFRCMATTTLVGGRRSGREPFFKLKDVLNYYKIFNFPVSYGSNLPSHRFLPMCGLSLPGGRRKWKQPWSSTMGTRYSHTSDCEEILVSVMNAIIFCTMVITPVQRIRIYKVRSSKRCQPLSQYQHILQNKVFGYD
jgi:hypothetical protein